VSKRNDWFIGLGIAGGAMLLILIMVLIASSNRTYDRVKISSGGDKIAVVECIGPIFESRRITRQFKQFGRHRSIRAIVFRIDSPGGGVAASQEIYEAVRRVRDAGKPVVVSMGSVAASGGYYVACGSDTIMANSGTTTGSIGVIAEFINLKELYSKIGIHFESIKSGRFKDTGSPHRNLTQSDRRYLQSFVDDAFDQFVDVVAVERNLSKDKVLQVADGRVFTGRQAMEYGLVDLLGDYDSAIQLAADLGGISGEPTVVKERRREVNLLDLLFQQIEGILRGANGANLKYGLY
jgi:protease-4